MFPEPHVILGVSVICAETAERAEQLALSTDLVWVRYQRGEFGLLPSPDEAAAYNWSDYERMARARAGRGTSSARRICHGADRRPVRTTSAAEVIDDDDPRSPRARAIVRTARDGQSAARGPRPAIRSGRFGRLQLRELKADPNAAVKQEGKRSGVFNQTS